MVRNFIEHRRTSANHPQTDGLAERCEQIVKRSIRRYIEDQQTLTTWDEHLPYLQLGYNCSKQQSSGHSPRGSTAHTDFTICFNTITSATRGFPAMGLPPKAFANPPYGTRYRAYTGY